MKLIGFEIKKLLGIRFLRIALALFLAINCALSFYSAKSDQEGRIPDRELSGFYELYFENPDQMDAYYRQLVQSSTVQDPTQSATPGQASQRYASEGYTDLQMFEALYALIDKAQDYPAQMDEVIASAEKNLAQFRATGISENSYNYRLQERIINTYSKLKVTVRIGIEHSHGWKTYFDFSTQNVFIFVSILLVSVLVVSYDRTNDMLQVIHCTAKNKKGTVWAKITVISLAAVCLVVLFSLFSFLAVGIASGFSSSANAIQLVDGFEYCQYAISIGQYHLLSLVFRALAFSLFGAFVAWIATLIHNRVISFCIGMLAYGLNYGLHRISYVNADSMFKNANLIAVINVCPLFARFRSFNFFGHVWSYVPLTICLYICLTVLFFALFGVIYVKKRTANTGIRVPRNAMSAIKDRISNIRAPQMRQNHLVKSELYKMLIASGMILVILLLTVCKIVYAQHEYKNPHSISDGIYYDYMIRLEGTLCDRSLSAIESERNEIDQILTSASDMQQSFINSEISSSEYAEYLKSHALAQSQDGYLEIIESKRDYLVQISHSGRNGWFLYDTGWLKLINSGADLFLILAIAAVCCQAFSMEYKNHGLSDGFALLLRSTPNGRRKTFISKIISVISFAFALCVIYSLIDIMAVTSQYSLPAAEAPLISMRQFESVNSDITILAYIVLMYAVRCAFAVLLALIISALSCVLRRGIYALFTVASAIVIPAVLSEIGLTWGEKFNYLKMCAATPLAISSFSLDFFGSDLGLLLFTLASVILIATALMIAAYRKFAQ